MTTRDEWDFQTSRKYVHAVCSVQVVIMADGERLYVDWKGDVAGQPRCGEFISTETSNNILKTPKIEENGAVCKWIIEAPVNKIVVINYTLSKVANSDGSCRSLQFQQPGCDGDIVRIEECNENATNASSPDAVVSGSVSSGGRWMCVTFRSYNYSNKNAFEGWYWSENDTRVSKTDVMPYDRDPTTCAFYEFKCRNMVCVSYGYVCDLINDCGCFVNGCDEMGCHFKRAFSKTVTFAVGFPLGVFLMCVVMTAGMCIEKRHNWYHIQAQSAKEVHHMKKGVYQNPLYVISSANINNSSRERRHLGPIHRRALESTGERDMP